MHVCLAKTPAEEFTEEIIDWFWNTGFTQLRLEQQICVSAHLVVFSILNFSNRVRFLIWVHIETEGKLFRGIVNKEILELCSVRPKCRCRAVRVLGNMFVPVSLDPSRVCVRILGNSVFALLPESPAQLCLRGGYWQVPRLNANLGLQTAVVLNRHFSACFSRLSRNGAGWMRDAQITFQPVGVNNTVFPDLAHLWCLHKACCK